MDRINAKKAVPAIKARQAKPAEQARQAKPVEQAKPAEQARQAKPAEQVKLAEQAKQAKPAGQAKPARPAGQRAPQPYSLGKDLLYLLAKIGAIAMAFMLLFTFMFGLIRYDEPSMAPSIKDGDLVVYYRFNDGGYHARDVVALEREGKKEIRRVVARAGDTVDISEDGLLINSARQQEFEIYNRTERYTEGVEFPLTVPEGHVFLLGDSRTDATDSRIYGCVKIEDTLGKVMTVIRRRGI